MILTRSVLLFLLRSPLRPTCVKPQERVHHILVLPKRVCPEVEVCFSGLCNRVHSTCRPSLRRIPLGLAVPVVLHVPQGPVHRSWVHCFKPQHRQLLHEFVTVRVPLPQRHQDRWLQPVLRTGYAVPNLGNRGFRVCLVFCLVHTLFSSFFWGRTRPCKYLNPYSALVCRGCRVPRRPVDRVPQSSEPLGEASVFP
jgi:hypothetical protein